MDKQQIPLIGALVIVAIALVGGIILSAKGIPVPAWLAGPLALIGTGFAWLVKPPGGDAPPADGAK